MTTLCFPSALQKGRTNPVYLNIILLHLEGLYHPSDHTDDLETLGNADPLAASLKRMIRRPKWKPIKDTTHYHTLLTACLTLAPTSLPTLFTTIEALPLDVLPFILQPMTLAAILASNVPIVEFCLSHHAVWDPDVEKAINATSGGATGSSTVSGDGKGAGTSIPSNIESILPPAWVSSEAKYSTPVFDEQVKEGERFVQKGSWEFGNPYEPKGEDWFG